MQNYLTFKSEYPYRDTSRKVQNDLKSDIKELEYCIDAIEPQIKEKGCGWLYGVKHFRRDLEQIKTELEYSKQLLKETV